MPEQLRPVELPASYLKAMQKSETEELIDQLLSKKITKEEYGTQLRAEIARSTHALLTTVFVEEPAKGEGEPLPTKRKRLSSLAYLIFMRRHPKKKHDLESENNNHHK